MTSEEIAEQLQAVASADDVVSFTHELTAAWSAATVGLESVEPILRFMEEHPELDYGSPGPLVHHVEEFCWNGYEEKLIESVGRRPTTHTVWMLNRVLNGTTEPSRRQVLVRLMKQAASNPRTDAETLERIRGFLEPLNG
jgi:hypothetical protein